MAPATSLNVGGLPPEKVYETLISRGISQSEATSFVGSWLLHVIGQVARTFEYKQAFAGIDPNCVARFARSFAHADWVDGESLVQAQQTTGELGFNARFHRVEADLDALGTEIARAFTCVAQMRLEMRALLDEIKTELNRIDADLPRRTGPPPFQIDPGFVRTGTFLGTTKVGTQNMTLWQTSQGMMMLPAIAAVHPDVSRDPRVERAGNLARFIEDHPNVRTALGNQAFTKRDFVTRFGIEKLPDGTTVAEQLTIVPDTASFANPDALITDLSDREAAALKSTVGADAVITSSLGLDPAGQAVGTASVQKLGDLPENVREALAKNGLDTIGKVADAGPQRIADVLRRESVTTMSAGDVAALSAKTRTLIRVR
jgi:hypothetical protein